MTRSITRARAAGLVHVLQADPDLAIGLHPEQAAEAREACIAPIVTVPRGRWAPGEVQAPGATGLLVLGGMLCRRLSIDGASSVELLGPGDLLQPRPLVEELFEVPAASSWRVLEALSVAVLDRSFEHHARRWPELHAALTERLLRRCRSLATRLAIAQVSKLTRRLYLLLWHLAERWGRVTREGVVIPTRLSHRTLAELACAQRPSVSEALKPLAGYDLVVRGVGGGWVLHGPSPAHVTDLAKLRARSARWPPRRANR